MPQTPEYFIGLQNTVVIRKGLLEAAKESVLLLKAQYRLRELRQEKRARIALLTTQISEVTALVDSLDADLPAHDREHMPEAVQRATQRLEEREHTQQKPVSAPKPAPKPKPRPVVEQKVPEDELRALEEKLASIESKLNKL